MVTIDDFKIGDKVVISDAPNSWSSHLNDKCPMHEDIYPYICIIQNIEKWGSHIAMTCGEYGWSLSSLIEDSLIKKLEKNKFNTFIIW
jgi:hypothetical protein